MANTNSQHLNHLYYSSVTWKIFDTAKGVLERKLTESPTFVTHLPNSVAWTLRISEGEDEYNRTEGSLERLHSGHLRSSAKPRLLDVHVRITVFDRRGRMWHRHTYKTELGVNDKITFSLEDSFRNLPQENEPGLCDSAIIAITCEFLRGERFNSGIDKQLRNLSYDLKKFSTSGELTDLHLKLGSDTVAVHSAIVKARSPYIARILNNNPTLRVIDLTHMCSKHQLRGLITYWYSGDIDELPRTHTPSTLNFISNMEQLDLRRYIDPESIVLSTTFDTNRPGKVERNSSVSDHTILCLPEENPYITLAKDLKNLWESKNSCDISLNAGGKSFRAHKAILAARTSLERLFVEERAELWKSSEIPMKDFDADDLHMVLKDMYYAEKINGLQSDVHNEVSFYKMREVERCFHNFVEAASSSTASSDPDVDNCGFGRYSPIVPESVASPF